MGILIRSLNRNDLSQILAVQRQNLSAAQWKETDYDRLIGQSGALALVATEDRNPGNIMGFAVFRQVEDEAELLNLAVSPSSHRRGIGRALMKEGIQQLIQSHAQYLFLEVRASNQPAISFYASMGFHQHSVRKEYYQNPGEDAYIFRLDLPRK